MPDNGLEVGSAAPAGRLLLMAAVTGKRTKPRGMTGPQQKYLAKLLKMVGEPWDPSLTSLEASRKIDELKARVFPQ